MSFLVMGLLYLGYGFAFWGTTLLAGGPDHTGNWPLLFAFTGLGQRPQQLNLGGQSASQQRSSRFEAGV